MHILSTPTFNNNLNCLSKNWKMPIRILGEIYIYTSSATYLRQQQTLQKYNTQKQNKKCVNYYEHSENLDLHYIFIVDTSNYQVIIKAISPGIPIRIVILTSYYSIIYLSIHSVLPTLLQLCGEGPFLFQKDSPGLHEDINAFRVNDYLMLDNSSFSKV